MPIDVVMPQMGESITEGTIVRWIKKVGDSVERDEPLFEISTDKVDAEIPSPGAGVVTEIRAAQGDTVPVDSVVAVITPAGEVVVPAAVEAPPSVVSLAPMAPSADAAGSGRAPAAPVSDEDARARRSSPVVRAIAKEQGVDISQLSGTGIGGRVTKHDILAYVAGRTAPGGTSGAAPAGSRVRGTVEPMSAMRKKIAEHMVQSKRTSAHVHAVYEVNFSRVEQARAALKAEHERAGVKLTYLPFIVKAVADALAAVPALNASIEGDSVVYHQDINVGVAVALEWGLIVPVVQQADTKDLLALSRAVADLAGRARNKQLKPHEVTGGTFTVTNPGAAGSLYGTPIINQPQVAILAVGQIEKRPVVIDDAIAIRSMAYLCLGFDHRIIDGVVADRFMAHVKATLEHWGRTTP